MTDNKIINEIQENYGEWLEMAENPNDLLVTIMASKIHHLKEHIEYLEKRLNYGRINTRI